MDADLAAATDEGKIVGAMTDDDQLGAEASPLARDAYQRLLDALTSLEIEPGERITVDSLVRQYHVSQTPIREALTRLEGEGLVVKHHLRGYRAAPRLDTSEYEELFAFRAVVEPAAAAWAASRAGASDVEELRSLQTKMASRVKSQGYGDFAVLDARFHRAIATLSGSRIMSDNLDRLHVHLHLFRVRRDEAVAEAAIEEHGIIVDAIERGDPILAEAAMRSHIDRSWSRLSNALELDGEADPPKE